MTHSIWSEDQLDLLREMYDEGVGAEEIAAALRTLPGCRATAEQVRHKCHRMGLPLRRRAAQAEGRESTGLRLPKADPWPAGIRFIDDPRAARDAAGRLHRPPPALSAASSLAWVAP